MTGHRRFAMLAAGAIDFDLAPRDRAALDDHLASCPDCAETAWRLRSDASAVARRPRQVPRPGMRDRFETEWLPRAGRGQRSGIGLALVAAAALVALGTVAIVAGGGRLAAELPQPTSSPRLAMPTAPAVRLPTIGVARQIDLSHGPLDGGVLCANVVETGCATDVRGAFEAVWTTATDGVVRLDPASGRVIATITTAGHPIRIASDNQALWVTVRGPSQLVRIDPSSNLIDAVFGVPGQPSGVVVSHGFVWVVDEVSDAVLQVDPANGAVVDRVEVGQAPWGIAATDTSLWASDRYGSWLSEVDPTRASLIATLDVPRSRPASAWDYGDGVIVDGEEIYVASSARVSRYARSTHAYVGAVAPVFGHLAVDGGRLWLVSGFDRVAEELDSATLRVIAKQTIDVSTPSTGGDWEASVDVVAGGLWVRSYPDDRILRIDLGE